MTEPEAIRELAELIEAAGGFVIRERDYGALESFVLRRGSDLRWISGINDYTDLLRRDPESDEWRRLLSEITITESYLFRGHAQFDGLRSVVLPELVERLRGRTLRIWCAGCARGEEAATLAIVLTESEVVAKSDWEILATDVDDYALEDARKGLFRRRAVARVPSRLLAAHFAPRGELFELDPKLRARISYRRLNLVNRSAVAEAGPFDVVFLRNVLIYFRPEQQKRVVDSVDLALAPDGCLFLGPSESLLHLDINLAARDLGGAFCYRRAIGRKSDSVRDTTGARSRPLSIPPPAQEPTSPPSEIDNQRTLPTLAVRLESAIDDLRGGRHRKVLAAVIGLKSDFPERPAVHLVEAIAHEREGNPEKAVLAYRAALYLAPGIGVVRFLLARALLGLGRQERSRKEYRSALSSLHESTRELSAVIARTDIPSLDEMKTECREMTDDRGDQSPA